MCGHIFLEYHSQQPRRHHQALWRCSACGRQSHMPLDCCTQPDYRLSQPHGVIDASVRWLGDVMGRLQTSIRARLMRSPQPAGDAAGANIDLPMVPEALVDIFASDGDAHQPQRSLADTDRTPVNPLLSDVDVVSRYGDVTEETPDSVHEVLLRS